MEYIIADLIALIPHLALVFGIFGLVILENIFQQQPKVKAAIIALYLLAMTLAGYPYALAAVVQVGMYYFLLSQQQSKT